MGKSRQLWEIRIFQPVIPAGEKKTGEMGDATPLRFLRQVVRPHASRFTRQPAGQTHSTSLRFAQGDA